MFPLRFNMHRLLWLLLLFFLGHLPATVAYPENYPAFSKRDKPAHLSFKILMEGGKDLDEMTVTSGEVTLHRTPLKEPNGERWKLASIIEISFRSKVVGRINADKRYPFVGEVKESELDGNGLKDLIIEVSYMGNGVSPDAVIILLQTEKGKFCRIDYDSFDPSSDDFVGLGNDGNEVLVSGMTSLKGLDGRIHSFWTYVPYRIKGFDLVMDKSIPDFPKFIQFTQAPNDNPTDKLSQRQKDAFLDTLAAVIKSVPL